MDNRKKSGPKITRYTQEIDDYIRLNYQHTRTSAQAICDHLNTLKGWDLKYWSIEHRAAQLGIVYAKPHHWNDEQDGVLRKLMPKYSPARISSLMTKQFGVNISEIAVIVRCKRIQVSRRKRDWYTKMEVCAILGVDHHTLDPYIMGKKLIVSQHGAYGTKKRKDLMMQRIERPDFADFFIKHAENFRGRNVDLLRIVEVLLPERVRDKSRSVTRSLARIAQTDHVLHAVFGEGIVLSRNNGRITVAFNVREFDIDQAPLVKI